MSFQIIGHIPCSYVCLNTDTKSTGGIPEMSTLVESNAAGTVLSYYVFVQGKWVKL